MTRIVAGEWKGHPLPRMKHGPVRPTTERGRTMLFDTLGDLRDLRVLDLFSGSGALGFEALSRGAASLVSVERDRRYTRQQQQWIRDHDADTRCRILGASFPGVLEHLEGPFDLILADPPYRYALKTDSLDRIETLLGSDGRFVHERNRHDEEPLSFARLELVKEKVVAETRFQIYKVCQK